MTTRFIEPGKVTVLLGGQFGSCGKGAASAWLYKFLSNERRFSVVSTNAGAQSGHISIHEGVKRTLFHLPTFGALDDQCDIYLNAGAVIRPDILFKEDGPALKRLYVHPNAAVITDDCIKAENDRASAQTRIASTRKGVGEAVARKVLRSGVIARDHAPLAPFVRRMDLNARLAAGQSVLLEVPQGISLSLNGKFYPHCTSRDCTVAQALSDAGIHPSFMGPSILVLRTYPIRVGAIVEGGQTLGESGGCYHDQYEIRWEDIGQPPETTTVTGRQRRIFSWSKAQVIDAMALTRPTVVYLTFCDYVDPKGVEMRVNDIFSAARSLNLTKPLIVCQSGPTTNDAAIMSS